MFELLMVETVSPPEGVAASRADLRPVIPTTIAGRGNNEPGMTQAPSALSGITVLRYKYRILPTSLNYLGCNKNFRIEMLLLQR